MIPQAAAAEPALWEIVALALILHVAAGCIAILAGAGALAVRKGERLHRAFGSAFVAAMLVMCVFATGLSVLRQPGTIIGGIFTFYLVVTARTTVRRAEGRVGRLERIAFIVGAACAAGELTLGLLASRSPTGRFWGYPAALYFSFGTIAALAAMGDLRLLLRGGVAGGARIARHVWRMCLALFMATGSFFLGQQKVMPAFLHGSPVLVVLGIAPLAVMLFWLVRLRSTGVENLSAEEAAAGPELGASGR